jgi:ankyrin repeat protein
MDRLIEALRSGNLASVRVAVKADPKAARSGRAMVEAGRLAFKTALEVLLKSGGDLNAIHRGYRALHSLIQERPHGGTKASPERLACLEWMLARGADPDLPAAWPPARAILVAAFMGEPEFVKRLKKAKTDGFVYAALGDLKGVRKVLAARPAFVNERDIGGLTALQCAAASRMPGADAVGVAKALLDAGADPAATTESWKDDVDAIYFAASAKNRDVFALLLDRGVDATHALTPALWNATEEFAELAMARGAAPDRATADGQPLLNHLIRWGQMKPAMWLLQRGASPNIADKRGWTAVHQAASRGNEKMVLAVLGASGDRKRKDLAGKIPRDVATREKIVAILRS